MATALELAAEAREMTAKTDALIGGLKRKSIYGADCRPSVAEARSNSSVNTQKVSAGAKTKLDCCGRVPSAEMEGTGKTDEYFQHRIHELTRLFDLMQAEEKDKKGLKWTGKVRILERIDEEAMGEEELDQDLKAVLDHLETRKRDVLRLAMWDSSDGSDWTLVTEESTRSSQDLIMSKPLETRQDDIEK
ncbi:hypothetical protein FA10DRAFT_4314 [Acaromyces ingoldii]|uniref:Uncharacterized protein n=1 Tax=Acaromyces ingoldii TaxID=215250 RepID=A0A316YY36_9BASI|nr:hypothetical protein FA10DRAFT_4314 [Acaromyces ingoldii]PWN92735.1 hypothetical protein FA10DRAFT_4314 [Acaromyces ingoldii]